jgi:hypothetical protein
VQRRTSPSASAESSRESFVILRQPPHSFRSPRRAWTSGSPSRCPKVRWLSAVASKLRSILPHGICLPGSTIICMAGPRKARRALRELLFDASYCLPDARFARSRGGWRPSKCRHRVSSDPPENRPSRIILTPFQTTINFPCPGSRRPRIHAGTTGADATAPTPSI